jgi:hypothetical protein
VSTKKLDILKLKAEAANCRRIAEENEGSVKDALLERAEELEVTIRCEERENNGKTEGR